MVIGLKRAIGFIWASPVTVIGLLYATLFAWLGWYRRVGRRGDALVWTFGGSLHPRWLVSTWKNRAGQTFGNVVVIRYDIDTPRGHLSLRHEQEHVRQTMTLGVFQPILYACAWFALKACRHAHPYYDNPFEIDARRGTGQVVDVVTAVRLAIAQGKLRLPAQKHLA